MEKSLQKKVIDFINNCPDCITENVSGNADQSGRADVNGCCRGQAFRIELKEPNQEHYKVTSKQIFNLKKWAAAGAICGVCSSLDHVSKLLDEYLNYCGDYLCLKCKFFEPEGKCYRQKNGAGVYYCKEKEQSERCAKDCQKVVGCYYFREKERLKKVDDLISGVFYPAEQYKQNNSIGGFVMDKKEFLPITIALILSIKRLLLLLFSSLVFVEVIKDDAKILQLFSETLNCNKQIFDEAAKVIGEMSLHISFMRAVWNLGGKCGVDCLEKK